MKKIVYEYFCDSCKERINDYFTVTVSKGAVGGRQQKEVCSICFSAINEFLKIEVKK